MEGKNRRQRRKGLRVGKKLGAFMGPKMPVGLNHREVGEPRPQRLETSLRSGARNDGTSGAAFAARTIQRLTDGAGGGIVNARYLAGAYGNRFTGRRMCCCWPPGNQCEDEQTERRK